MRVVPLFPQPPGSCSPSAGATTSTVSSALVALCAGLDRLARAVAGAPRPSVVVLECTDSPFSAGHWVPDPVVAGGGRTVLHHGGADSRRVDWDDVAGASADVVLMAPRGYSLEPACELAAALVAGGRADGAAVWAVDADSYVVRPGPRLVDGAELVGQILHPDGCGPPDPDRARRIA